MLLGLGKDEHMCLSVVWGEEWMTGSQSFSVCSGMFVLVGFSSQLLSELY